MVTTSDGRTGHEHVGEGKRVVLNVGQRDALKRVELAHFESSPIRELS